MDIWQLIERDHENIARLIREIPYALNGRGVIRSRERMLADLMDELELHAIGLEASLYAPLGRESGTQGLVSELRRGQAEFMRQLRPLARYRTRNPAGWLDTFEDVTFLVDQHLHRHVHELIPEARRMLSPEAVNGATRAFVRAKTSALRNRRHGAAQGILSSEAALITTAAAVAAGFGYLVWRGGLFDGRRPVHRSESGARHAR
jgi:hypothetical protein